MIEGLFEDRENDTRGFNSKPKTKIYRQKFRKWHYPDITEYDPETEKAAKKIDFQKYLNQIDDPML